MSDKRRVQGQMSERSATLADPSRLMSQAFDRLADLENATVALGEALVATGLPQHAWRSEQATLHLLSEALPAISFGAFLAGLEDFAARSGPVWLRGTHDDMEAFNAEVSVLSKVARPLLAAVRGQQRAPFLGRRRKTDPANSLQRALRHPRLQAPLAAIVEILSEFEARAPLMKAIQSLQAIQSAQSLPTVQQGALAGTHRAPDFALDRPKAFPADTTAAAGGLRREGRGTHKVASAAPTLPVGLVQLRQRLSLSHWSRRGRLAASAMLALPVVVVGTLLILSHGAPAWPLTPFFSSSSSPAAKLTALAGSATTTAAAAGAPAPKLALSCTLQGATATLTLKNVGTSTFTWQVQPSPTLTTAPAQGALDAGQSAVVQVSAKNKKTPTGTIQVVANHGNLSTENRVSCR